MAKDRKLFFIKLVTTKYCSIVFDALLQVVNGLNAFETTGVMLNRIRAPRTEGGGLSAVA